MPSTRYSQKLLAAILDELLKRSGIEKGEVWITHLVIGGSIIQCEAEKVRNKFVVRLHSTEKNVNAQFDRVGLFAPKQIIIIIITSTCIVFFAGVQRCLYRTLVRIHVVIRWALPPLLLTACPSAHLH